MSDLISRQAAQHKINALIDEFETIMKDIRERHVDDSVCGLCEYDGAFMSDSGNWCNECPGFERDDCFKLKDQYREEWAGAIKNLPPVQPNMTDEQFEDYCRKRCLSVVTNEFMYEVRKMVPPKRGKWIERESGTEDKENGFETVIVCSRCDYPATTFYSEDCESRTQIRTAFCPTCGADMRGGE